MASMLSFGSSTSACRTATSGRAEVAPEFGKFVLETHLSSALFHTVFYTQNSFCDTDLSKWWPLLLFLAFVSFSPDDKGNLDPDRLLQCPFDKNHQIRSCRFPYHLIKCRKVSEGLINVDGLTGLDFIILSVSGVCQFLSWHIHLKMNNNKFKTQFISLLFCFCLMSTFCLHYVWVYIADLSEMMKFNNI